MKPFTVVWDRDVEASFFRYWLASDSKLRAILTEVANWVDTNLATDPGSKGQLRADLGARIIAVPLTTSSARVAVTFEVSPDDQIVREICFTFRGA
jgi:hypothetical protein